MEKQLLYDALDFLVIQKVPVVIQKVSATNVSGHCTKLFLLLQLME